MLFARTSGAGRCRFRANRATRNYLRIIHEMAHLNRGYVAIKRRSVSPYSGAFSRREHSARTARSATGTNAASARGTTVESEHQCAVAHAAAMLSNPGRCIVAFSDGSSNHHRLPEPESSSGAG